MDDRVLDEASLLHSGAGRGADEAIGGRDARDAEDAWWQRFWTRHRLRPLAPVIGEFGAWMTGQGYALTTRRNLGRALARLDAWIQREDVVLAGLSAEVVRRLVEADNAACPVHVSANTNMSAVTRFLGQTGHLRDSDDVPAEVSARQETLREWLDYLRTVEGQGPSWIGKAAKLGDGFLALVEEPGGGLDWSRVDVGMANAFLARGAAGYSCSTAQTMAALLRGLLGWAADNGWIGQEVADGVLSVRRGRPAPPAGLSPDQIAQLIEAVDTTTVGGLRDVAIIVTAARLGLRAAELAGLQLEDIDWQEATMRVIGKGRRVLVVPIPVDVGQALVEYLRVRIAVGGERHVFVRVLAPLRAMTRAGIGEVVTTRARIAGLEGVHAHTLRHSVARQVLARGGDLRDVQELLGHADQSSSLIYARADVEVLRPLAPQWGRLR